MGGGKSKECFPDVIETTQKDMKKLHKQLFQMLMSGALSSPLAASRVPLPPAQLLQNTSASMMPLNHANKSGESIMEKYHLCKYFITQQLEEHDKKHMKKWSKMLWKKYHVSKDSHLTHDELISLVSDSLHYIHTSLQAIAQAHYANVSQSIHDAIDKMVEQHNSSIGSSGKSRVDKVDWPSIDVQLHADQQHITQSLELQLAEWQQHALDIVDALWKRMDVTHDNKISEQQFIDNFSPAIHEIVGPHFFSKYLANQSGED